VNQLQSEAGVLGAAMKLQSDARGAEAIRKAQEGEEVLETARKPSDHEVNAFPISLDSSMESLGEPESPPG
jgi:hypothetical protein